MPRIVTILCGLLLISAGAWGGVRLGRATRDPQLAGDLGLQQGWLLRLSPRDHGRLVFGTTEQDPVRVELTEARGEHAWDITLVHPAPPLAAGKLYRLRLRLRGTAPRQAALLVQQNRPPFQAMGLWKNLELSPEWIEIDEQIRPTVDEPTPLVVINLGGQAVPIEVADLRVEPVAIELPGQPPAPPRGSPQGPSAAGTP